MNLDLQGQFETCVNGKWILAGEHSVLRGYPALVFPLASRFLRFIHEPSSDETLQLHLRGAHGEELQLLFWGVLEKACDLKQVSRADLRGQVSIESSIPVGAGLGASAALSVAVSKWFHRLQILEANELLEFARELENLFHGESSGVDLAVALSGRPLKYRREIPPNLENFLEPKWQPQWQPHCYLSYSGQRGVTRECVTQVKNLLVTNPQLGNKIDQDMGASVQQAEQALALDSVAGLKPLAAAVTLAGECFLRWGLTEGPLQLHMQWLRGQGALAVKPTGSGSGGYVLSLWEKEPPAGIKEKLIPCF